jgi:all-trans-retinol 13,14-reductase
MADQQYDIVIVGSGLGGLLCAAILSKEGLRVCLIEKNEQIGGNLQTFKRDGVTFDTGVHYLGGLEKGQNLYKIFNYCGIMARLELAHMDKEGSDVVLFKNDATEYPYGMGYTNFIRVMTKLFPTEETNIKKYCSDIQKICRAIPMYNLDAKGVYPEAELFTRSAKQYFENLTSNEKLRNVLAGTNMLYAGVGNKTPLYVHALVVNSYIESAMKCTAGGDQIAKLLARVIKENNGDIFRKQKVTNFVVQNGEINHVLCHNNEKNLWQKIHLQHSTGNNVGYATNRPH